MDKGNQKYWEFVCPLFAAEPIVRRPSASSNRKSEENQDNFADFIFCNQLQVDQEFQTFGTKFCPHPKGTVEQRDKLEIMHNGWKITRNRQDSLFTQGQ